MNNFPAIRYLVPAIACTVSLLTASAAFAAPAVNGEDATRSLAVRYSHLELSTVAGATSLYRRIAGAARFVCGSQGRRMEELDDWQRCYRNALSDAVAEVNSPLLTAVHRRELGEAPETAMLSR